jgi:hypothetical protein
MASVLVEEKMKENNYLIVVTNDEIKQLKVKNINFLFPIKGFSVGFTKYYNLDEVDIKNSYIYINRVLDDATITKLKSELKKLNANIIGICFTDLGIVKLVRELKLNLKLIYMQNHNTTNVNSINYYLEYVDSVLVSTDITKEEIINILDKAEKPLVVPYFMLVDAMYSRRTLLSNYGKNFNIESKTERILKEPLSNNEFVGIENEYGTILYQKKFIDYRSLKHQNIMFYFINPYNLDNDTILKILNNEDLSKISNTGFLDKKTYYKLKERL